MSIPPLVKNGRNSVKSILQKYGIDAEIVRYGDNGELSQTSYVRAYVVPSAGAASVFEFVGIYNINEPDAHIMLVEHDADIQEGDVAIIEGWMWRVYRISHYPLGEDTCIAKMTHIRRMIENG